MTDLEIQERYQIVSHLESDRPFRIVGSAYKKVGDDNYTFYLRILPGIPFYIAPHWDRPWEYLLFSGKSKSAGGSFRFFCKVGSAVHLSTKKAIEIHLPDLRQVFYLKLEPEDLHYEAKAAA